MSDITSSKVDTTTLDCSTLYLNGYGFSALSNTSSTVGSSGNYYLATRYWAKQNCGGGSGSTVVYKSSVSTNGWVVGDSGYTVSGTYRGVRYCDDAGGNSWGGGFTGLTSIGLGSEGGFYIAQRTR